MRLEVTVVSDDDLARATDSFEHSRFGSVEVFGENAQADSESGFVVVGLQVDKWINC